MIRLEDVPWIQFSSSVRNSADGLQECAPGLRSWLSLADIQGRGGYAISIFKVLSAIKLVGADRIAAADMASRNGEDYLDVQLLLKSEAKLHAILADAGVVDEGSADSFIEKVRPIVRAWGNSAFELTLDPNKTFEDLKSFFEEVEGMSP
jgi:hypothetical protein